MRLDASRTGAVATLALHAVILAALLAYAPARSALLAAAPMMVDWIAAPKPRPVVRRPSKPVEPPPVIAAQPEPPTPAAHAVPAPLPEPEPVAAAPAPALAVLTPPIFNATYLDNPAPQYPLLSRRAREQGRVVLHVLVNPSGRADEVEIRASSGFSRLDDTARETVKRWKFVPAKRGSEPVAGWVLIPISFGLEG